MSANAPAAPVALAEKIMQGQFERFAGHHAMKGESQLVAEVCHRPPMTLEFGLIFRTHHGGVEVNLLPALDILKQHRAGKIQGQLVWIQHLKHHQIMTGGAEPAELLLQFVNGREQVGDQEEQTALAHEFRHAAQRLAEIRGAAFGFFFQREHELAEMPVPVSRGQIIADALRKYQ